MCFAKVIIVKTINPRRSRTEENQPTYTRIITPSNIVREFENSQPESTSPPTIQWDELSPGPTASEWFNSQ